jgi:aspartyl-tRNA(Asn)/glutamyl-tRNA(Gln) amidotransferase subunit B
MRTKEYAHDYRYFPDPDLLPVVLSEAQIDAWRANLPELPAVRRARLIQQYSLPEYDAGVLVSDKAVADFFEAAAAACGNPKAASNWVMTEVLRCLKDRDMDIGAAKITPRALGELIKLVDARTINMPGAKDLFAILFERGGDPAALVKEKGMAQVSDTAAIEAFADQAIAGNEKSVTAFRAGKEAALQHLVGQVMKLSRGKANPGLVQEMLRKKLGKA